MCEAALVRQRPETITERNAPELSPGEHVPRTLLQAWHGGTLPPKLRASVAAHLDACPDCRRASQLPTADAPKRGRPGLVGQRVGRYLVESRLGEGGMGAIYLARDSMTGRPVAMKVLLAHLSDDDAHETRFRVEAKALASVSHRNVVALLDSGDLPKDAGQYLVMELLEGESLAQRLQREVIPRDEVIDAIVQACAGLEAVHQAGVLHRDLKPGNLFRCRDGTVKLIDFGIARDTNGTQVTAAGLLMGTVGFVAPELLDGEAASVQSDLYAVGIAAWRLLTRTDPFKGKNVQERIRAQLATDAPHLRDALPDVSPALDAALAEVLARDPARRPRSAAELGHRLADILLKEDAGPPTLRLGDEGAQPTIKVGAMTDGLDALPRPARSRRGLTGNATVINPPIDLGRRKK